MEIGFTTEQNIWQNIECFNSLTAFQTNFPHKYMQDAHKLVVSIGMWAEVYYHQQQQKKNYSNMLHDPVKTAHIPS